MKKRVMMLLLSLAIAFGLWLYVVTVVSPDSEDVYYVPVVLEGETALNEKGLMVTSDTNVTVTLRVAGSRTDLVKLNNTNINVVVDLSKIYDPGEHQLQYTVSFPGDIPSNAVETQSQSPNRISVTIEEKVTKYVPVNIVYSGSVPDGFITDKANAVLDNPNVAVTGPSSIIDQIDAAYISVDLTDRSESISENFRFTLCNEAGEPVDLKELVTTTVTEVRLDLKIERVKEITPVLEVIAGGGATEQTSLIKIEPEVIRISGNETALSKIDSIVLGTINLGELTEDTQLTFPIELPEGVTNLTGVTEATVRISFPKLQKKELTVTNITPINVPEGLEVDMLTEALTVTVRGPSAMVSSMTADDLSVTVDFSGVEIGTAVVKADIKITSAYADVGAIGTYSVSATLREAMPDDTTSPE